ncbi:3-dehydroquinate synthase [Roseiterribacter gracilis]|uniref:3-dehydroquinate synthase n=1 Tax=Roseiterribacter gracilis TaxID=2812848 RepID=A0A8S8XB47_9PROT|nr:3-dehydroquinate synthase [Rhodospirillales bacterium TMPK1]
MTDVTIALDGRSYDVAIGRGLLEEAGARIAALKPKGVLHVATDATVADLHLQALLASCEAAGLRAVPHILPPGEASKSWSFYEDLSERILAAGVERGSMIVALGGGVIGDLAGFVAATMLRGIDFVQIPTTLLAQVDSSVGGKVAIDTKAGKNLVGAFWQPRLVLADLGVLDSLPLRELRAGWAEIAKYGLIDDPAFFAWCEANGKAALAGDDALRAQAVAHSVRAKARVVAADERESSGVRALLNLGHTFGHALESALGFDGQLLHGEAVAIGCCMAFDLSVRLGLAPLEDAQRVRAHFANVGLPTEPPAGVGDADALLALMQTDKKVADGRIVFVLTRGIGRAFVARDVSPDDVRAMLGDTLKK